MLEKRKQAEDGSMPSLTGNVLKKWSAQHRVKIIS